MNEAAINIEGLIGDLALILVTAAVVTVIFKKLKQPLVLGYIVAGFLVSPNFVLLPSIANQANIEFWSELGIIVMLFSLGLEFSFKKLVNVGGAAIITATVIVTSMSAVGFSVGKALHFDTINAIFLGAMISMSSTTIIIKAISDLRMKQRRFVPMTFAVLVCEDLFAVLMMVILSSIAVNNSFAGTDLLLSIAKMAFFLILWFLVGVYVLPSFFRYFRRYIDDEILLVLAMGLCFMMAVLSVYSGFSLALGAFVMGSILAGTTEAEHIEKVTKPVKDLFGAVFFISVGMMVNPAVILQYIGPILLLSTVVMLGMITFGTSGMLISGQPLKFAIETGFSLVPIGDFAFIIATLGMGLGVLDPTIYPIIVAVSVITTFFTPYSIKVAEPFYRFVEKRLPESMQFLITRYSATAAEEGDSRGLWREVLKRYTLRLVIYVVILLAIAMLSLGYLLPFATEHWGRIGRFAAVAATLAGAGPFLVALTSHFTTRHQRERLNAKFGGRSKVPLIVMTTLRFVIVVLFIIAFVWNAYDHAIGISFAAALIFVSFLIFSKRFRRNARTIEEQFVRNLNVRERRRSGQDFNLISDLHVAYVTVGYECPFVGERLANAEIRQRYGVNVVSIQRGGQTIPVPGADRRIFPGDVLGIIGSDEKILRLLPVVEKGGTEVSGAEALAMELHHINVAEGSKLVGHTSRSIGIRDDYSALLVAVQRGEEYLEPNGTEMFQAGDILWLVGDRQRLAPLTAAGRAPEAADAEE